MGNIQISQNFKNKMKYLFQVPCSGMRSTTVATPVNVAIPICCHIKYTIITICTGPIQTYARKMSTTSNRLTSFDRRFTAWPTVLSPKAVLLSFNAWNYNAKTEHKKLLLLSLDKAMWCSTDRLKWFLGRYHTKVKNEILTTVHISMVVFWVAMPYGLVHGYQRFGGTYCLHLQGSSEVC